jgi:organic hydroperoxide reductase OsmC/OhrA
LGSAQFDFTDLQVDASGTIRKSQFGYDFSAIVIRPNLKIASSKEREHALDLLKKTERLCLVSRTIDVPLRFEPQNEVIETVPLV